MLAVQDFDREFNSKMNASPRSKAVSAQLRDVCGHVLYSTMSIFYGHSQLDLESPSRLGLRRQPFEAAGQFEHVGNGDVVPVAAVGADAAFDRPLQIEPGQVHRHAVAERQPGEALELDPSRMRQPEPYAFAVDQEFDIHGVGVASGDAYHQAAVFAMEGLQRERIGGREVLVHGENLGYKI